MDMPPTGILYPCGASSGWAFGQVVMDFMLGGRMGERTSFADEDDFEAWLARIMAENIISTEETDATNETPVTHGTQKTIQRLCCKRRVNAYN